LVEPFDASDLGTATRMLQAVTDHAQVMHLERPGPEFLSHPAYLAVLECSSEADLG
jgi:hypothetical protein